MNNNPFFLRLSPSPVIRGRWRVLLFALIATILSACRHEQRPATSVIFGQAAEEQTLEGYDLDDVQAAGELIAVTLSGPDTYYEYRGQGFGLQFDMAQSFANTVGARLRMEMAADTADLLQRLLSGEADLIALETDSSLSAPDVLRLSNGWCLRTASSQLAQAYAEWWNPSLRQQLLNTERQRSTSGHRVRRSARPVMLSRQQGIISAYDEHFVRVAQRIGWDWRLLAAQCYQESAFDPQAVSWAGACGLMQIMPSTGSRLGLSRNDLFVPSTNIDAAGRYIQQLSATFSDVRNPHERILFVLAAYNGGAGHIRDAMTLATAAGHSPQRWSDVEPYVLALASPAAYRNPSVKYGYLRGEETVDYVRQIRSRWAAYRGVAHPHSTGRQPSKATHSSRVRPRSEYLNDTIP